MTQHTHIDHLIAFTLSGRFAHFRKFYTNSSSLSYLVPPRTVIMGILASILMVPRDAYYETFDPESCKLSVSAEPGSDIKKTIQSVNLLHDSYYSLLNGKTAKAKAMHSQCKMELLLSGKKQPVGYIVFAAFPGKPELAAQLQEKLDAGHRGYGVYMGQRQFRADAQLLESFGAGDIDFMEQSDYVDSICLQDNVISIRENGESHDFHVVAEQMPVHMKAVDAKGKARTAREPAAVKRVLFEKNGNRLFGTFKNCYRVGQRVISFY